MNVDSKLKTIVSSAGREHVERKIESTGRVARLLDVHELRSSIAGSTPFCSWPHLKTT